jgi:hypothetical protein
MRGRIVAFVTIAATLVAAGCASTGPVPGEGAGTAPAPAPASRPVEPTEGRRALERAVAQFEQGRFPEAIRLLQESPEILADGPQVRAQALKQLGFAQCVTGRRPACRRSFDALLTLDPAFELTPAEAGHPSWGTEFERAKAAARGGAAGAAVAPAAASTRR